MYGETTRGRTIGVALIAAAAALMAGCGDSGSDSGATSPGAPASTTAAAAGIGNARALAANLTSERAATAIDLPVLARKPPAGKRLFVLACSIPVCHVATDAAVQAGKRLGWEVKQFNTALTPEAYAQAWSQMLQAGKADYIAYTPITPNATVAKALAQARANGTKMVNIAPAGLEDVPGVDGVVATIPSPTLFKNTGATGAVYALADAGKPTSVLAVADPTFVGSQLPLAQGFLDQIKKLCPTCSSDLLKLSLSSPVTTNTQSIINYLQGHKDVKHVWMPLSTYAPDLPRAMQAAGVTGVKVVVAQPSQGDMENAKSGEYAAVIQNENSSAGWRVVDALARVSVGEGAGPDEDPAGYTRILTKDNITSTSPPVTPGTPGAFLKAWRVDQ